MIRAAIVTAGELWRQGGLGERALYLSGAFMIVSGLLHVPVYLFDDLPWEGAVSWRKPILFGLSTGVTFLSLGWVLSCLLHRRRRWVAYAGVVVALAGLVEVGLITMQAWRGVPSHFNTETAFDTAVHIGIDVLIGVITLGIVALTIRSLMPIRAGASDTRFAIRAGMIWLLLSCLFGFWMLVYGTPRAMEGLDPGVYGEAGLIKFVHGMPIHALQFLPVSAWVMLRWGVPERSRLLSLHAMNVAILMLTVYASIQTFAGRDRFDVTMVSLGFLVVAGVCLLIVTVIAVVGRSATTPTSRASP
ncbi:hypothetical protein [Mucisphaera sp.]|uniref:hypothetical protein n=1 Tax=Mucisphaera sp. TaxID=2913024 RepID=UPI003D0F10EC